MKNRLIELLEDTLKEWECDVSTETIEQIAEHLIQNGVIVPPCEVGCEVWFCDQNNIYDGELISFSLDAAHLWFNCRYKCGLNYWHKIEDFGKTVFADKEEAERKLKEIEGKW